MDSVGDHEEALLNYLKRRRWFAAFIWGELWVRLTLKNSAVPDQLIYLVQPIKKIFEING